MTSSPRPAVVIPTWNGWEDLQRCLRALDHSQLPDVVVVDNGSEDGTAACLGRSFPEVSVLRLPTNLGFAAAVNAGIVHAAERDVVLLNNDTVPEPGWLDTLVSAAATAPPRTGFVTSKIVRLDDGRIDSVGDFQTWAGVPYQRGHGEHDLGQWEGVVDVFSGCGGATWYRREMLQDVGLFDPEYFAYYEDVDLCSRAQLRGWTGLVATEAVVGHAVSATSGRVEGFKRYQSTRNGWWLVVRTVPSALLLRLLPKFLLLQVLLLVQAARRGELRAALRGHRDALRALPRVLRERRQIQSRSTLGSAEFGGKLMPSSLRGILRRALSKRFGGPRPARPRVRARVPGEAFNADAAIRYDALLRLLPPGVGTVLEVGSGSAGVTAFAQLPFVVGCDLDFAATAELDSRSLHRVSGDATRLPFRTGTFDVTLCVDALEHFPAAARGPAVAELVRVTRSGGVVLLAAPMGRWASRGDRRVNDLFSSKHGIDHPWLSEHLEAPLPDLRAVRRVLDGLDVREVIVHRNAWLPLWVLVQRAAMGRNGRPALQRVLAAVAPRLNWAPSYRRILEIRR